MNKKYILLLFVIVLVGVLAWRVRSTIVEKAVLRAQVNPVVYARVEVATPKTKGVMDAIETWGQATANATVTVTPTLGGKILEQRVDVGSVVKQGDVLAKIDRNLQPLEYSQTDLISPASGVITKKFLDNGAMITTQTPIYLIEDVSNILIQAPVAQKDIGKIRKGLTAEVRCSAYPNEVFHGNVTKIEPTANDASHATMTEITIKDSRLKPGMYLQVRILIQNREALFIAGSSLQTQNGKQLATVFRAPMVHKMPVTTGIKDSDWVEILSGLSNNDTVVTSGSDFLTDGDTVIVAGSSTR